MNPEKTLSQLLCELLAQQRVRITLEGESGMAGCRVEWGEAVIQKGIWPPRLTFSVESQDATTPVEALLEALRSAQVALAGECSHDRE